MLAHIKKHFQVTVPLAVRKVLGLREGDLVDVQIQSGRILLTPKRVVDHPGPEPSNSLEREQERVPQEN